MEAVLFYVFAAVTVVASLLVIGQRNPMHSVLLLILSFGGLSALYIELDSPFAAMTQIIVYGGAIMVLFLFVVMLLNNPREEVPSLDPAHPRATAGPRRFGAVLAAVLAIELGYALMRLGASPKTPAGAAAVSSVREIGVVLFTEHAFAFEVTSVLILVAMVGAVVLAKRHL